jgi:hypothetical protein
MKGSITITWTTSGNDDKDLRATVGVAGEDFRQTHTYTFRARHYGRGRTFKEVLQVVEEELLTKLDLRGVLDLES